MADTANFGWTKPTVGGDTGAWGGILNTLFDDIDTDLNNVKTTADAALPKAGGQLTGEVGVKNAQYTKVNKSTMTGTVDLDMADGNFFYGTKSGSLTLTFTTPSDGKVRFFMLELTNGSGTSFPASVEWDGGSAPTLSLSGKDLLVFYTYDDGTTWNGSLAMSGIA